MTTLTPGGAAPDLLQEKRVYAKVVWRLVPFLFLFYVVAYLDRVNVGFAKLEMLAELRWSDTIYGWGAGMFFIGYFIFEVPGNLVLYRLGARRWIACMMIIWGLLSAAMMFVKTPGFFYGLRFALGLAEAGFFPGIIFYLTYWFPKDRRGRVTALFMTAVAISGIVGGPLSGWIMKSFHGAHGLSGWQWLFVLEGLPSVAMGFLVFAVLDDSIRQARWLTEDEKLLLERNIAADVGDQRHFSLAQVLVHGRVWFLCLVYFLLVMGLYGIGFWLPQIIKNTGVNDLLHVGLLTAIPYGVACVVMVWVGKVADRTGERRRPLFWCGLIAGFGFFLSGLYGHNTPVAMFALTLATAGTLTALPLLWSLPTEFLGGTAAAAGIGLINSIGNLAGFVSPYMVGVLTDATHSTTLGLDVIAVCVMLGGFLGMVVRKPAVVRG